MSLTPPTVSQLFSFLNDDTGFGGDDAWAAEVLCDATRLMQLATGLSAYPDDPALTRVVRNGIMDLAQYLVVQRDNAEEEYTPFSSEHIGSYSYSKALTRAQYNIANKLGTGVFWFDQALQYVFEWQMFGSGSPALVTSEHVMPPSPEYPVYLSTVWVPDHYGR